MGRIVLYAFQARLDFQKKLNRSVTQKEVADAIGITQATLRRIERNETSGIDFETLRKLCDYYGIKPGDIIKYEGESLPTESEKQLPRLAIAI